MIVRRFALVLSVLLALAALPALAQEAAAPEKTPEAEFRAGWIAIITPAEGQQKQNSLQVRQDALLNAIPHFEAAVQAEPANTDYSIALAYAQLSAAKYQKAKDTLTAAIERKKNDPVLYLLRAQADAALGHLDPETTAQSVEKALRSFDDAARLDPGNSLYSLQAASVAFDAQRGDLGLARVQAALKLPAITLPILPIPFDLDTSRTKSVEMWQALQMRQWMDLLVRCQNAGFALLKQGEADEKAAAEKTAGGADPAAAGEGAAPSALTAEQKALYDKADELYRTALDIGKQMGNAKPNGILAVSMGLNMMEAAYAHLLHDAEATGSQEALRWQGEGGVVQIGRGELLAALQQYKAFVEKTPPSSVSALMKEEGEFVARTMLGVSLSPTEKPKAFGKPNKQGASGNPPAAKESAPGTEGEQKSQ
jgi:tetratricopeptide (TPR) repeat protein